MDDLHHAQGTTRRQGLALLLAAAAGVALKPSALWAKGQPSDLMPAFWAAWAASKAAPDPAAALFEAFFQPRLALYSATGHGVDAAQVRRWLPMFTGLADGVRKLADRTPATFAAQQASFLKALPDFRASAAQVYFTVSLLRFDGKMVRLDGRPALVFGLDMIALFHGIDADLKPLFDHESFHLYHQQVRPEPQDNGQQSMLDAMWREGLATYASEQMNPGLPLLGVLLNDKRLAAASEADVHAAAAELLTLLNSRSREDYRRFFNFGAAGVKIPRLGYRVGLEVARRIGSAMPLAKMARLGGAEREARVTRALKDMTAA